MNGDFVIELGDTLTKDHFRLWRILRKSLKYSKKILKIVQILWIRTEKKQKHLLNQSK